MLSSATGTSANPPIASVRTRQRGDRAWSWSGYGGAAPPKPSMGCAGHAGRPGRGSASRSRRARGTRHRSRPLWHARHRTTPRPLPPALLRPGRTDVHVMVGHGQRPVLVVEGDDSGRRGRYHANRRGRDHASRDASEDVSCLHVGYSMLVRCRITARRWSPRFGATDRRPRSKDSLPTRDSPSLHQGERPLAVDRSRRHGRIRLRVRAPSAASGRSRYIESFEARLWRHAPDPRPRVRQTPRSLPHVGGRRGFAPAGRRVGRQTRVHVHQTGRDRGERRWDLGVRE